MKAMCIILFIVSVFSETLEILSSKDGSLMNVAGHFNQSKNKDVGDKSTILFKNLPSQPPTNISNPTQPSEKKEITPDDSPPPLIPETLATKPLTSHQIDSQKDKSEISRKDMNPITDFVVDLDEKGYLTIKNAFGQYLSESKDSNQLIWLDKDEGTRFIHIGKDKEKAVILTTKGHCLRRSEDSMYYSECPSKLDELEDESFLFRIRILGNNGMKTQSKIPLSSKSTSFGIQDYDSKPNRNVSDPIHTSSTGPPPEIRQSDDKINKSGLEQTATSSTRSLHETQHNDDKSGLEKDQNSIALNIIPQLQNEIKDLNEANKKKDDEIKQILEKLNSHENNEKPKEKEVVHPKLDDELKKITEELKNIENKIMPMMPMMPQMSQMSQMQEKPEQKMEETIKKVVEKINDEEKKKEEKNKDEKMNLLNLFLKLQKPLDSIIPPNPKPEDTNPNNLIPNTQKQSPLGSVLSSLASFKPPQQQLLEKIGQFI